MTRPSDQHPWQRPEPDLDPESNIGRTDLIQRDADFDDNDATGMSAGPTNRRGTRIDPADGDPAGDPSAATDDEPPAEPR